MASHPVSRGNMNTFFPRFPVADFSPFFRLVDEELNSALSRPIRAWQPRFDVREEKDAFHLSGELPGLDATDLSIEFADDSTLVVKGRTVRSRTEGTQPEAIEGQAPAKQVEDTKDDASSYRAPTVEDEGSEAQATPTTTASELAKSNSTEQPVEENGSKYWVSERSVGEFHRTFAFPGRVDQDTVSASLKNGILSIVVPKVVAKEPRKININ